MTGGIRKTKNSKWSILVSFEGGKSWGDQERRTKSRKDRSWTNQVPEKTTKKEVADEVRERHATRMKGRGDIYETSVTSFKIS